MNKYFLIVKNIGKSFLRNITFNIGMEISQILPDSDSGNRIRGLIYKPFFKKCGANLQISKRVHIINPDKLNCGKNVYIGYGTWIFCGAKINFEDEVMIGPYVCITSSNHTTDGSSYRFSKSNWEPITLKKGCWIASHVTVTAGNTIGENTVIGANAVVTKNTDSNSIYTGIPAKKS